MQPWPRLSRAQLQRDNLLCTRHGELHLDQAGELALRLTPAAGIPPVALSVPLMAGQQRAWLGLGEGLLAVLAGTGLGIEVELEGLPDTLVAALLEVGLAPFLQPAGALLDAEIHPGEPIPGMPPETPEESLVFDLAGIPGVLWYEAETTPALLALLARLPVKPSQDVRSLPFAVAVVAGCSGLGVAQLQALAPEDVLLLETHPPESEQLWLRVAQRTLALVHYEAGRITIIERLENSMSEEVDQEVAEAPPVAVEDLPVQLSFEVGRLQLSIAELQALQVGQSFALEKDPSRPVTIRANGQRIATGELVQIDDTLGVRILELHLRHG